MDELMDFDEVCAKYDPVLGLECHVELSTKTKLFDRALNAFGGDSNTYTTPTSLGLPGALPTLNRAGIEYAIRLGLALNCKIASSCRFARKQYFYPDLSKNFQTSQSDEPLAYDGYLDIELDDGEIFRVHIERAHVEEDAGKNVHMGGDGRLQNASYSLVDYNRAGVPLVEIVTKPLEGAGARAPEVAAKYVKTIRDIARAIGVSEARMERGNIRADVNVSLRPSPTSPYGTRTETKNVNSFKGIEGAVIYEMQRQGAVLEAGGSVLQETRHWIETEGKSISGRPKSDADDYRYFPEPDLVPVVPSKELVESIRAALPELPAAKQRRLKGEWAVSDREMRDIVNADAVDVIDAAVQAGASPAGARKWWMGELARYAKESGCELADVPVTAEHIAELDLLVTDGTLTDKLARQALEGVLAGEGSPREVVTARGLEVVSDDAALAAAVDAALAAQPDVLEKIRSGKVQAAGAIVGAVMKATGGKADAARVRELIMERAQ
ncbi:Asp-tRNA(Asn)/Glu-tRNA(Gln) amidotransferase subunit GatB [Trueperella sp. LYQ143]|uniref:Asp-tRNA(Asn)/Glu-tRNA(Gln) amidotransferase subunit GatB n=1 Tax=unclassified Trueperella TaxID=2630174 RepID=UPI0039835260